MEMHFSSTFQWPQVAIEINRLGEVLSVQEGFEGDPNAPISLPASLLTYCTWTCCYLFVETLMMNVEFVFQFFCFHLLKLNPHDAHVRKFHQWTPFWVDDLQRDISWPVSKGVASRRVGRNVFCHPPWKERTRREEQQLSDIAKGKWFLTRTLGDPTSVFTAPTPWLTDIGGQFPLPPFLVQSIQKEGGKNQSSNLLRDLWEPGFLFRREPLH